MRVLQALLLLPVTAKYWRGSPVFSPVWVFCTSEPFRSEDAAQHSNLRPPSRIQEPKKARLAVAELQAKLTYFDRPVWKSCWRCRAPIWNQLAAALSRCPRTCPIACLTCHLMTDLPAQNDVICPVNVQNW
jgi:hypothetical protein